MNFFYFFVFFFQAEDGIRDYKVTGVQTCALPILDLAESSGFERGEYDTDFVAQNPELGRGELPREERADIAAALSAIAAGDQQIGRASCRERVEIAVGGGAG